MWCNPHGSPWNQVKQSCLFLALALHYFGSQQFKILLDCSVDKKIECKYTTCTTYPLLVMCDCSFSQAWWIGPSHFQWQSLLFCFPKDPLQHLLYLFRSSLVCHHFCLPHLLTHSFFVHSHTNICWKSYTCQALSLVLRVHEWEWVPGHSLWFPECSVCGVDRELTGHHNTMWWVEKSGAHGSPPTKPAYSKSKWELRGENKLFPW